MKPKRGVSAERVAKLMTSPLASGAGASAASRTPFRNVPFVEWSRTVGGSPAAIVKCDLDTPFFVSGT